MLSRLGFTGRIIAIVMLMLFLLMVTATGLSYLSRSSATEAGIALPLPDQVAAIVELIDAAQPEHRPTVLRAVNSDTLRVTIAVARPTERLDDHRFRTVEWMIRKYVAALGLRDVVAFGNPGTSGRGLWHWMQSAWHSPDEGLLIAVGLNSSGYAVFETRGELVRRVLGWPPGFWLGIAGAAIGCIAILTVMREAKPLRELVRSIGTFAATAKPEPVVAGGAPEFRALMTSVNDMQERIAALLKGRTVLLGAISHDLKTFLTRLRLRLEDIPEETSRAKAEKDLEDMATLIDDALVAARGAATSERREVVDLRALAEQECHEHEAGDVILAGTPTTTVAVLADAGALRRVLANLVGNALRYGSRCRIEIAREGSYVVVHVDDDGPGVPPEERQAIFEPFYRLETSRSRQTGGSGLGLTIVKQIIDAHGGTVTVTRAAMGGSRFSVRLPVQPSTG